MQYLAIIYEDENLSKNIPEARQGEIFQMWMTYTENLKKAGVFVAGDALQPVATATTVRKKSGDIVTVDGPFAETKEQLGGYYLLECKDLDQALEWARKCPAVQTGGCVEVRPIMVFK